MRIDISSIILWIGIEKSYTVQNKSLSCFRFLTVIRLGSTVTILSSSNPLTLLAIEASNSPVNSQRYYLDEWLVCALNQVQFATYVSDTYSFAYLTFPKQDYYWHNVRHLKWVKATKFLILRNGTSMSATNQQSSKWYPRMVKLADYCSLKLWPLAPVLWPWEI